MVDEISRELELGAAGPPVDRERVRGWMQSDEPDVRGSTYALLTSPATLHRIAPALPFEEVFDFVLEYFAWCLREDPKGEWVNSRYSAGWDLVGWVCQLSDAGVPTTYLDRIKAMLERLYRAGTADVRRCITDAVLEHLFERRALAKLFDDWRQDPELNRAWTDARQWVDRGGTSPLTKSRPKPTD